MHDALRVFEAQYKRVFEATECRTQRELAAILEIRQSSISDAKRRKSIPAEWLITLLAKKCINPQWILRGNIGAKYLIPADAEQAKSREVHITKIKPPQKCSTQELFNELVRRAMLDAGQHE